MQSFGHGMAVTFMNTQQKWLPVKNLHNTELSDIPSWRHGGQGSNKTTLSQKSTRQCRQLKFSGGEEVIFVSGAAPCTLPLFILI